MRVCMCVCLVLSLMSWVGREAGWAEAASEGFQADCEAVRGQGRAIAGSLAAVMGEVCGQGS